MGRSGRFVDTAAKDNIYYALCVCSALSPFVFQILHTLSYSLEACLHLRTTNQQQQRARIRQERQHWKQKRNEMKQHKNHLYARVRVVFAQCGWNHIAPCICFSWMACLLPFNWKRSWRIDVWNGSQHYLFICPGISFFAVVVVDFDFFFAALSPTLRLENAARTLMAMERSWWYCSMFASSTGGYARRVRALHAIVFGFGIACASIIIIECLFLDSFHIRAEWWISVAELEKTWNARSLKKWWVKSMQSAVAPLFASNTTKFDSYCFEVSGMR